ncbi:Inosine/uridine-preferring nucleoside hydrolase [Hortaea werneckii]|nr:Inosine/uridine-preferring nucleoside hydrolase [Hortaea werneckii]
MPMRLDRLRGEAAEHYQQQILEHLAQPMHGTKVDAGKVASSLQSHSIWLDCDTGHDDAFAILLAARSPELRLLGISTVYGNAPLENTTRNTCAVLEAIGRRDVPVYPGATGPLQREACFAPGIHGETGLDGTTCLPKPIVPARTDKGAVEAMFDALSAEPPGTAWLVAVGTLSNVAMLFNRHPELAEHIAGLSVMGGCIGDGFTKAPLGTIDGRQRRGNWTEFAEFNIYSDPEAARFVFSNPTLSRKTTLIPLDLTHQFLATEDVKFGLLFGSQARMRNEPDLSSVSTVRRLFFEVLTFFAKTYAEMFDLRAGPPTHDPLAVAVIFRPDLFYCNSEGAADSSFDERFQLEIVSEGQHGAAVESGEIASHCGQTIAHAVPAGGLGVRIPRGLNDKALWGLIESCLSRTERHIGLEIRGERREASGTQPIRQNVDTGQEDMVSLVRGGNVTLSEFEASTGLMPDIKGPMKDKGGVFLQTNKEESLGVKPRDLSRSESEQEADDDAELVDFIKK